MFKRSKFYVNIVVIDRSLSHTYTHKLFFFAHLVDLAEGSSSQQAQISEALTEIGLLFAGIIYRVRTGRLTKGTRQGCPGGWVLGEHPAQRGTSLGRWQRGQKM